MAGHRHKLKSEKRKQRRKMDEEFERKRRRKMDEEFERKRRRKMEDDLEEETMATMREEKERELESYQRQMDRDLESKRQAMEVVFQAQTGEQSKLEDERLRMLSEDMRSKSAWALCALQERKKAMSASHRILYAEQRVIEQERQNKLTDVEKKAERRRWLIKEGIIGDCFLTQEEKDECFTPMQYGQAMRKKEMQRQTMDFIEHLMSLEINLLAATDVIEVIQDNRLELHRFPLLYERKMCNIIYTYRFKWKRWDLLNQYFDYIIHLIKGDYIRTSTDHDILLETLIIENPFPCLEMVDMDMGLVEYVDMFKFGNLLDTCCISSYEEYKVKQLKKQEARKLKKRDFIGFADCL